jgi:hypothetical protein
MRSSTAVSLPRSRRQSEHSPARFCSSAVPTGVAAPPSSAPARRNRALRNPSGDRRSRRPPRDRLRGGSRGRRADRPRLRSRAPPRMLRSARAAAIRCADDAAAVDQLWQASLPGGHRFAHNVVVLPYGIWLGRSRSTERSMSSTSARRAHWISIAVGRSTHHACRQRNSPCARSPAWRRSATCGSWLTAASSSRSRRPQASSLSVSRSTRGRSYRRAAAPSPSRRWSGLLL